MEYRSLDEDEVDVFFVGTSHVYCGIDGMYIYENSGITTYNISTSSERFDTAYLSLQEALKTQSPDVIFLDMSAIQYRDQAEEAKLHWLLDQIPLSLTKLQYVLNCGNEELTVLDALFPFFRYHSRWDELSQEDFQYLTGDLGLTFTRGHYITYEIVETKLHFYEEYEGEEWNTITETAKTYISKIEELCKENGIELIMFKIPTPEVWNIQRSMLCVELADEMGLTFWDLSYEVDEIGLDVSTDFSDSSSHLNQYGAEKVSDYIMRYLEENYDFADQRGNNERWDEDLEKYKIYKEESREETNQNNEQ
ncbi:MAG: hypothetical protein LUH07_01305 [Lachnospiraceae bacterium]|nr:hypothetical protein [Lachnospiraceae bacterium]